MTFQFPQKNLNSSHPLKCFFSTQMSEIESKVAEAASSQQGLSKTLSQMGKAVDDLGRLGCHYQTGADLRDKAAACLQREKTRLAEELFRTRVELKQAKEEIQQMRAEGKEGAGEKATKARLIFLPLFGSSGTFAAEPDSGRTLFFT